MKRRHSCGPVSFVEDMKTRIDIVFGYPGSGKSTLISQMISLCADCGSVIHFDGGSSLTSVTAAHLAQLIRKNRPNRVLLESSAKPDAFCQLFALEGLASQAYKGTQALVIDASHFIGGVAAEREYTETYLRLADIVFVSHATRLSVRDRHAALARVWEMNRHLNVAVEPYTGVDLWRMFDLPSGKYCVRR